MVVERMKSCESVDELAKELGVTRRCLYKWRTKLEAVEPGEEAARPSTHASAQRKEILQLKRLLAEKAMEVDFLKGALQKVEARRRVQTQPLVILLDGLFDVHPQMIQIIVLVGVDFLLLQRLRRGRGFDSISGEFET